MNYRHLFIFIGLLTLASCGPKQEAKKTIKEFVDQNVKTETDYSFSDFGKLDSTRYVTDSLITVMRQNANKNAAFNGAIGYGKRTAGKQLKYLPVKMSVNGSDTTFTFYLTNDLQQVVSFK